MTTWPGVYLQGELRIFYLPLAVVVGPTLFASIFVSFTFIPALAARIMAPIRERPDRVSVSTSARRPLYIPFYAGLVGWTLRRPWVTVLVAGICLTGSFYVFQSSVSRHSVWGGGVAGDRSYVQVSISMPRGTDLDRVDELTRTFEARVAAI